MSMHDVPGYLSENRTIMTFRSVMVMFTCCACVPGMAQLTLLDPGFGQGGIAHFPIGQAGGDRGEDVVLAPDGGIFIAGTRGFQSGSMAAVKLLPTGDPDPAFSGDGIASAPMGQYGEARAVALQPDGKVLIGGSAYYDVTFDDLAMARFTAAGVLDTGFSGNGRLNIPSSGSLDLIRALTVDADGRILAAGKYDGGTTDMMCLRVQPNGELDPAFASGGIFSTTEHTGEVCESMMLRDDGKIVLGGGWRVILPDADLALFQLDDEGAPDPGFGTDGLFRPSEPGSTSTAISTIGLEDGRVLFLAKRYQPGGLGQDAFVGRVMENGGWDLTYGTGGRFLMAVGAPYVGTVRDMVLLSDDKALVSWDLLDTSNNTTSIMVMRVMPDGGYDSAFGTGGRFIMPCPDLGCSVEALAVGADDRVVAVGSQITPSGQEVMVMRWLPELVPESIKEERAGTFTVYPVPSADAITIANNTPVPRDARFDLMDASGRIAAELTPERAGNTRFVLPQDVRNGIYALRMTSATGYHTARVIVQR